MSLIEDGFIMFHMEQPKPIKTFLLYNFPAQKDKIKKLSYEEKMEWYSSRNALDMVYLGNNPHFQEFWKWNVIVPMKIKRLFYRIKNGEIFKRYQHISEIRPQKK